MPAKILDGRRVAGAVRARLAVEVAEYVGKSGRIPKLAAVCIGNDPASHVYLRSKQKACQEVGMDSELFPLPAETTLSAAQELVHQLNSDHSIHGILIQLPLPGALDTSRLLDAIHPLKDVDGFHPENVGRLVQGRPRFSPCTPLGIQQLLAHARVPVAGKRVVIVGRSDIVGKPLAMMLAQRTSDFGPEYANGTVTLCHSRTPELGAVTGTADILVAAVGVPRLVTAEMIRPGATVVDVGINRMGDRLVGDVDYEGVLAVAAHLTPVPGGVGPMTVAMLLHNTLRAARLQSGKVSVSG